MKHTMRSTMFKQFARLACTAFALCQIAALQAYQPYHAIVSVGANTSIAAPNVLNLINQVQTSLKVLSPLYTPTSAVAIGFNLRGILALSTFAENSTSLVVNVPQANFMQIYNGATRDASLQLFKDSIKEGGNHHRLLKAYAKYSPIDPIAGNPNSLLFQMAQSDYQAGNLSPLSGCTTSWSAQPIKSQVQAGSYIGRSFAGNFDTTVVTMPLRYSYSPNLHFAYILDAPLTYLRNGGASSIIGSLGLGIRYPVTHAWSLTPLLRMGCGGSLDLCTSGNLLSAGVTSVYNFKLDQFVVAMNNYGGYFSSTNLWLTGINYSYKLHNYILKNGLTLKTCHGCLLCHRPINFSLSFTDSVILKDRLYINHFDEVSIALITQYLNPYLAYDCLSLGFTFQFGQKDFKGYNLNIAYQF